MRFGANPLTWLRRIRVPLYVMVLAIILAFLPQGLWYYNNRLMKASPAGVEKGLELKELIIKVKSELAQAERQLIREGGAPLLALKDVDLEINFVVHTKANAEAKLVAVSGATEVGQEKTQKIRLHLTPIVKEVHVKPQQQPIIEEKGESVIGPEAPPAKKRGTP